LSIVKPSVVVALGRNALNGFIDGSRALRSLMETAADSEAGRAWADGYIEIEYYGLRLNFVFLPHPAARLSPKDQIEDYRRIWRALRKVRGLVGTDLVRDCFSKK